MVSLHWWLVFVWSKAASEMGSKLTIIIPVFNVVKWLPQCLESVLVSDSSLIEFIAVDDGSTDGCSQILDDYAQRFTNFKLFRQENLLIRHA